MAVGEWRAINRHSRARSVMNLELAEADEEISSRCKKSDPSGCFHE